MRTDDRRTPARLKARAVQWLAARDHSRSELAAKLQRWACQAPRSSASGNRAEFAEDGFDEQANSGSSEAIEPPAELSREDLRRVIDAVLDELQTAGWLDEDRFVESRVRVRSARFGNRRIHAELAQHGIELSAETSQALVDTELERCRQLLAGRYPAPSADLRERARRQRFLAARGFSSGVIARALAARDD